MRGKFESNWKNLEADFYKNDTYLLTKKIKNQSFSFNPNKVNRVCFRNEENKTIMMALNPIANLYRYQENTYMGELYYPSDDYGKLEVVTLRDSKNLSYLKEPEKNIFIYLPKNYQLDHFYDVIYAFDGQSLFEHMPEGFSKSIYGTWRLDEIISKMADEKMALPIIVGIDNGSKYRDQELTMDEKTFGPLRENLASDGDFHDGKLDDLGAFLKETVIPYIESHYPVIKEKQGRSILGSSSGGLGAFYCGLKYKKYFDTIYAFSPAVGLFLEKDWEIFFKDLTKDKKDLPKLILYCGEKTEEHEYESILLENLLFQTMKPIVSLLKKRYPKRKWMEIYIKDAYHQERFWSSYLTEAFLFGRKH